MLTTRWHKVIRDLWNNKARTLLITLSIAVGVFAFGSVFITQQVLITDMNDQYRAINPSTISFSIKSFDDDLVRWIQRQPDVVSAAGSGRYMLKMVKGDEKINLDLRADEWDDSSINRVEPELGQFPPDRGQIIFERDSLALSEARIGDTITVETPNGRKHELTVTGTVHDLNAMPASMFPQLSGYVSTRTVAALELQNDYNRLSITVSPVYDTTAKLEKVADSLKERLERNGITVDFVQVREPGEHWGRAATDGFSLILTVIGFFSLILSGFLVVNTVSALLAEQKKHIGIMKAVGGTSGQIAGVYLALVSVYGLLALLIAVPVGLGLAYIFTSAVAKFLNIDIVNFHLPGSVLALQVIAALAVPVIASIIPVFGGVRITVREAISSYGIKSKGSRGIIERALVRIRFLPRPALLSLRNTFRKKARLAMTLGTLTLAGTLFISVVNSRSSLRLELLNLFQTDFNYEVHVVFDHPYERLGAERKAQSVPGVLKAEGRATVSAQAVKSDGTKGATISIIGVPGGSDFVQPRLLAGRWLERSDRNALVLSSKLADEMPGVQPGDEITLWRGETKHQWKVVGIMFNAFERMAYGDFDYVSSTGNEPGLASTLLVRVQSQDGDFQTAMAKQIESSLKKSGVGVAQTMTKDEVTAANSSQFDFMIAFLLTMAGLTALIGGLGLAGMMSLNVMERTREIGIMRSIGARHSAIGGIIASEGMLIGVLSWCLAVPLSVPFSLAFDSMLGQTFVHEALPFVFEPVSVIAWLAIVVVISGIASLLPALRATRMSIRETLAYE